MPSNQTTLFDKEFDPTTFLLSFGVQPQIAKDWLTVRKAKKLPPTKTALEGIVKEAQKAGMPLNDALRMCCENSWGGFKASWLAKERLSDRVTTFNDVPAWEQI